MTLAPVLSKGLNSDHVATLTQTYGGIQPSEDIIANVLNKLIAGKNRVCVTEPKISLCNNSIYSSVRRKPEKPQTENNQKGSKHLF